MAKKSLIRSGEIRGTDPRDGSALAPVAVTRPAELPQLVADVRTAADSLAPLSLRVRAKKLKQLGAAILARGELLRAAIQSECGKPAAEAWLHEITPTADLASFWSSRGPELLEAVPQPFDPVAFPGKRAFVARAARGVIGLITPWNFPVAIPLRALFPALLAGNGVVWKPSEHTPRSAALIAEAIDEVYGPGLVTLVQGGGKVGAALVEAGVDAVLFTGSVSTGRKVAAACAKQLIPVSLELGGKDAALVLADANIERAARGVLWGGMCNTGQNCASIERVFVDKKIAQEFKARLVELAEAMEPSRDFGPLTTRDQLSTVKAHVAAAIAAGATVGTGGKELERDGNWHAPTVLFDVPTDCEAMQDETFGPVICVNEVESEEQAVREANNSRFGLTASVWTTNLSRGEALATQIRAGVVMVNNHGFTRSVPALPWTGVGESGYGVTNSEHTLDVLTRPRALVIDARRAKSEMWWYPYTDGLRKVGESMARLRGGDDPIGRIRAVGDLLGGFAGRWKNE